MMRKGAFGEPHEIPEEIQGTSVTFRFASPGEKAKRQIEEATVFQGLEKVMGLAQVRPEILDRFNFDEIGKFVAKANDFPAELTNDDKTVEEIKESNAQAQQQQNMMDVMERGAGALGKLPAGALEGGGEEPAPAV